MKTRELVEAALMSAIIVVFVFLNIQLGGIFVYFMFLMPLPLVFVSYKYGFKTGVLSYVVSLILTLMLGDIFSSISVFIEGIIGVYYGWGLKKGQKSTILLLNTILLAILYNVITIILSILFFNYDINAEMEIFSELFNGFSIDVERYFRLMTYVTIPLMGIMEGYLTHVASRFLLARLRYPIEKATSVYDYQPPKWTGYIALILTGIFYICLNTDIVVGIYQNIGIVIGIVGAIFLCFYGVIAIMFILKLLIPKANLLIIMVVMFALFYLLIGVLLIGFLYITTDIKRKVVERIMNAS